jgi:F5/8 type C domain
MIHKNIKRIMALLSLCIASVHALAGTDNIAVHAKVSASTTLNNNYKADNVKDGLIGIANMGEWACEGVTTDWGYVRFPWIQLNWEQPQAIDKVVLYDRPSANEYIASGKLLFSDGSMVWVNEIPNDGTAKVVQFVTKNVTSIRFITTDGDGKDLGFSEIEVYPARTAATDYVG